MWQDEMDDKDDNKNLTENDDIANLFSSVLSLKKTENTNTFGKPRRLFQICHGQKLNWVTTSSSSTCNSTKDTIFVSDTSSDITSYTIPMG
jgi:hypothetical protein